MKWEVINAYSEFSGQTFTSMQKKIKNKTPNSHREDKITIKVQNTMIEEITEHNVIILGGTTMLKST
jgi:hypothetical protein